MNVNLSSISRHVTSLFKDHLLPTLAAQHKKILFVASLALGSLACYLIRCRLNKFPKDKKVDQIAKDPTTPEKENHTFQSIHPIEQEFNENMTLEAIDTLLNADDMFAEEQRQRLLQLKAKRQAENAKQKG